MKYSQKMYFEINAFIFIWERQVKNLSMYIVYPYKESFYLLYKQQAKIHHTKHTFMSIGFS